jgi:hypothetical protein
LGATSSVRGSRFRKSKTKTPSFFCF